MRPVDETVRAASRRARLVRDLRVLRRMLGLLWGYAVVGAPVRRAAALMPIANGMPISRARGASSASEVPIRWTVVPPASASVTLFQSLP